MSEKKRAGYSRLQKMSTYDDLVDQASEDKKLTQLCGSCGKGHTCEADCD